LPTGRLIGTPQDNITQKESPPAYRLFLNEVETYQQEDFPLYIS